MQAAGASKYRQKESFSLVHNSLSVSKLAHSGRKLHFYYVSHLVVKLRQLRKLWVDLDSCVLHKESFDRKLFCLLIISCLLKLTLWSSLQSTQLYRTTSCFKNALRYHLFLHLIKITRKNLRSPEISYKSAYLITVCPDKESLT